MQDEKPTNSGQPVSRRFVIKTGGALALTMALPLTGCGGGSSPENVSSGSTGGSGNGGTTGGDGQTGGDNNAPQRARFLDEKQLDTLAAFTERMVPADSDPGALAACCADAIDHLLAAFQNTTPFIYAGAPFSDRGGHPSNEFENFLALDKYEALAWRIAIEGSQGIAEREFNGPVVGMQQTYSDGLAALNESAQQQSFDCFSAAPAPVQDQILSGGDARIQALIDIGFIDTLDAMYGPPEYGGNCDLVGWGFTSFDGDTQPRGYTDQQVVFADNPGAFDLLLPASYHDPSNRPPPQQSAAVPRSSQRATAAAASLPIAPSPEIMAGLMSASNGSLSALRKAFASNPALTRNQPNTEKAGEKHA